MTDNPFNWQGKPSVFVKQQDFNGVNAQRSTMQTRIEPRPLWLTSDSMYLKQPKTERTQRGRPAKI